MKSTKLTSDEIHEIYEIPSETELMSDIESNTKYYYEI